MLDSLLALQQSRFIAVRHDHRIQILERPAGDAHQYIEMDEPEPRLIADDDPRIPDTLMTTRYTLLARSIHGVMGTSTIYMPSDWTDEECMAWTTVNMGILRVGFALRFPHGNY